MKLFLKILLLVLVALVTNVNATSATITFPTIREAIAYSSFHPEIAKVVGNIYENDLIIFCRNRQEMKRLSLTGGTDVLSKSELLRIENVTTRTNKLINVIGSRATGKTDVYSFWGTDISVCE